MKITRLLCWLGLHRWKYQENHYQDHWNRWRDCGRCGKSQRWVRWASMNDEWVTKR